MAEPAPRRFPGFASPLQLRVDLHVAVDESRTQRGLGWSLLTTLVFFPELLLREELPDAPTHPPPNSCEPGVRRSASTEIERRAEQALEQIRCRPLGGET